MDLSQLHAYLGELIEAGMPKNIPVVIPGMGDAALPSELSEAALIVGAYDADPAPLAPGEYRRTEQCLLLHGTLFDPDSLRESHSYTWPSIEPPAPNRGEIGAGKC